MKRIEVKWLDAGCEFTNLTLEDAKSLCPMPRKNIGYLVCKDNKKLVMCFGFIEDEDKHQTVHDVTLVIPKGMITSIKELK